MATFGLTTQGGTLHNAATSGTIRGCKFTCGVSGKLKSITIYCAEDTANAKIKYGLYSDNAGYPNLLLGTTVEWTITAGFSNWKELLFAASIPVVAGTDYWLAWNINASMDFYYNAGAANQEYYKLGAYNALPNPFPVGATGLAREYSIYGTVLVGASGSILSRVMMIGKG